MIVLPVRVGAQPAPTQAARPTVPPITAVDLRTRLYLFADDSMMGREAGTPGNAKATEYIAGELRRMGLRPAGENGTYFQAVPLVRFEVASESRLEVDGTPLRLWVHYAPLARAAPWRAERWRSIDGTQVIYGGVAGDSTNMISAEAAAGRFVVLSAPRGRDGAPRYVQSGPWTQRFSRAAAIAIAQLDLLEPTFPGMLAAWRRPQLALAGGNVPSDTARLPVRLLVTAAAAAHLLGTPPEAARLGALGRTVGGGIVLRALPNKIAV